MKKQNTLIILALILFCSPIIAQKKVAIVTFYVDKHIDFSSLNGNAALAANIMALAEDPAFDLQPTLEEFHKVFMEDLAKEFPFEFIDEGIVINNEEYKKYENFGTDGADENKGVMQRYLTVPGYKPLLEVSSLSKDEHRAELDMLKMFGDVDGVMFIRLDYSFIAKVAIGGMGAAGMNAWFRMKLWNKEGKKVFAKNESATSKTTVALVAGVPVTDPDEILPMCQNANEKLIADLKKKMGKIVSKVEKKL